MPLNIVLLRPQNWSRLKPYITKHYYRRQGIIQKLFTSLASWLLWTLSRMKQSQAKSESGLGVGLH